MLIGEHQHTLDSKHRLSLPAKFRKEIGPRVVLSRGFDNCLFLFSEASWKKVAAKLETLPVGSGSARGLSRFILAGASEEEIDRAGRVLIPESLREFAGLSREVVITGVLERAEIWDKEVWKKYRKALEGSIGSMAEALGEAGRF